MDNLITHQIDHNLPCSRVAEKELDRRIAKGRQDIRDGNYTPVTKETTNEFIQRLSKKLFLENDQANKDVSKL